MKVIRWAIRSYMPWMHRGILLSCIGIFVIVVALSFVVMTGKIVQCERSMNQLI